MKKIVIAIDGFASCGKSTLARGLARLLNYVYIDSGAMYRAVALFMLENNTDIYDPAQVDEALSQIQIEFRQNPSTGTNETYLNGRNVEREIRDMRVSNRVSQVSRLRAVRRALVHYQQEMGKQKGIVMDGRDIGTVVFPDAALKIFMTADFKVRVDRRHVELMTKGSDYTWQEIADNLRERDHIDTNREESPLTQAADAVVIDTTALTPEQQLEHAVQLVRERVGEPV